MKELIEFILRGIVNHPDQVSIELSDNGETISVEIKVNPDDIGKVIGKSGKTINSIRSLAKIIAMKQQKKCSLNVSST